MDVMLCRATAAPLATSNIPSEAVVWHHYRYNELRRRRRINEGRKTWFLPWMLVLFFTVRQAFWNDPCDAFINRAASTLPGGRHVGLVRLRRRGISWDLSTTPKPKVFTNTIVGTDPTTKPDYEHMVGPLGRLVDQFCMTVFRNQLRDQVLMGFSDAEEEQDSVHIRRKHDERTADLTYYGKANFTQIVSLASAMNAFYSNNPKMIQYRAQNVLSNLFPSWLPRQYKILFSQPFPIFSAQMNARVTAMLGVWLMGECTVNDIVIPPSTDPESPLTTGAATVVGKNQGVLVTRCRFLEEAQCASVCVNSCKLPTQNFFLQQMGIPVLMEPNYTDGSCQFSFGRFPNATTEHVAMSTPCLARCPTAGSYRRHHNAIIFANHSTTRSSSVVYTTTATCSMMGNDSI